MTIHIPLAYDTENTFPSAELVLTPYGPNVILQISDSDRRISVPEADLRHALNALIH